jgi:hypothetical protein
VPPGCVVSARLLAVACLRNVWVCARDLQLIRADRIISLLVPVATGYGAASPDDHALHRAVSAEIEGGTGGETLTWVELADCGKSPAAELLASLAAALGTAAAAGVAHRYWPPDAAELPLGHQRLPPFEPNTPARGPNPIPLRPGPPPAPSYRRLRDCHHDLGDPLSKAQMLLDVHSARLAACSIFVMNWPKIPRPLWTSPRLQQTQASRGEPSLTWRCPRIRSCWPHCWPHYIVRIFRIWPLSWSPLTESNRRPSPYHESML